MQLADSRTVEQLTTVEFSFVRSLIISCIPAAGVLSYVSMCLMRTWREIHGHVVGMSHTYDPRQLEEKGGEPPEPK